jgi:hypothetical protein
MPSSVIEGGRWRPGSRGLRLVRRRELRNLNGLGLKIASLTGHLEDRGSLNNMRQILHSDFALNDIDAPADNIRDGLFPQLRQSPGILRMTGMSQIDPERSVGRPNCRRWNRV